MHNNDIRERDDHIRVRIVKIKISTLYILQIRQKSLT